MQETSALLLNKGLDFFERFTLFEHIINSNQSINSGGWVSTVDKLGEKAFLEISIDGLVRIRAQGNTTVKGSTDQLLSGDKLIFLKVFVVTFHGQEPSFGGYNFILKYFRVVVKNSFVY